MSKETTKIKEKIAEMLLKEMGIVRMSKRADGFVNYKRNNAKGAILVIGWKGQPTGIPVYINNPKRRLMGLSRKVKGQGQPLVKVLKNLETLDQLEECARRSLSYNG